MNHPFTELPQSKTLRAILGLGLFLIVALLIFQAGVYVGYRKASFTEHLGDNFYRAFEGGQNGAQDAMMNESIPGGHGAVGKIVSLDLPTVVISTPDDLEETVLINADTAIRHFRDEATSTDLALGDFVVVIGEPNAQGQIEAKLIRVVPSPDTTSETASTTPSLLAPSPVSSSSASVITPAQ